MGDDNANPISLSGLTVAVTTTKTAGHQLFAVLLWDTVISVAPSQQRLFPGSYRQPDVAWGAVLSD